MGRFALHTVGVDRPGIVAAVTNVLVQLGCNLEDSTMATLQGHFAMLLVVSAPEGITEHHLQMGLTERALALGLHVGVRPLAEDVSGRGSPGGSRDGGDEQRPWTFAVHGADRPGIVHAVADALASGQASIVDLTTHLVGDDHDPLYVMAIRALLPTDGEEVIVERVRDAARSLGVHCTAQPDDADDF